MKKFTFTLLFIIALTVIIPYKSYPLSRGIERLLEENGQNFKVGKQYLVLIAINDYKGWAPLRGPVNDAKEIGQILESRYYFDEILTLYNKKATKKEIVKLFRLLQTKLRKDDSVLIFFAGHGMYDVDSKTGFWIPIDGGHDKDQMDKWIPNCLTIGLINNIKSKHILLISDSCYAGDLLYRQRSELQGKKIPEGYFKKAYALRSRQVITSGSLERVPDNSEFSYLLKKTLEENAEPFLDAGALFRRTCSGVKETLPALGELPKSGHEPESAFLLFLKNNEHRDSIKIGSILNQVKGYQETKKFSDAAILLTNSLIEFVNEKGQKKLQLAFSDTHYLWAEHLRKQNDFPNAIKHFNSAYDIDIIWRPKKSAIDLFRIGFVYFSQGQREKAVEYYKKALSIFRKIGDKSWEATISTYIGLVYSSAGQKRKALKFYKKAVQITNKFKEYKEEVTASKNVDRGRTDRAQKEPEYIAKALKVLQEIGNSSGEATILNNIGAIYSDFGQKKTALEYYKKALLSRRLLGNRTGEATTLNNIGTMYAARGENQKAFDYYRESLQILQEVGDRSGEAVTFNNIGRIYSFLGQKQLALEYFEKSLISRKVVGDKSGEALTLNDIGEVYSALGQKQKALGYFEKALSVMQVVGDRSGKAAALNNIGELYSDLGQKHKALEYYEKTLPIRQSVGDRIGEAATLNNIGKVYSAFGQKRKALEYFEKALPIMQVEGNRSGEAITLNNIGKVYSALDQKLKALEYFEKALPIMQAAGDRRGEAITLNNIGQVYSALGEKDKALESFEKALPVRQEVRDRSGEAITLNNIGELYTAFGQIDKALTFFEKALPIRQAVADRSGEATTFKNLMFCWKILNNKQFSIYYGKQSVNAYQDLRQNISSLDKELRRSYLETIKGTYRYLADLMIDEGRISEARAVLDMLEEEEFFQFIRRAQAYNSPNYKRLDFNRFEKMWLEKYNNTMKNFSRITAEYYLLKNKTFKSNSEKGRMEELEAALIKSRMAYHEYLIQLKKAFAQHDENIKKGRYQAFSLMEVAKSLQSTLGVLDKEEGGKNVMLHYLVHEGKITVILTTPYSQAVVRSKEIGEKKLNRMIMQYRMAVRELVREPQAGHANMLADNKIFKELYDVVFKPVDEELKKCGATNLMVYLDGVLRYVPLSTLWDGESYLVQRYRIALFTTSSLPRISLEPSKKMKMLSLGASLGGSGFSPLPNIKDEIRSIVRDKESGYNGFIEGKALVGSDFTRTTMLNQLRTEKYTIVHIASHFKFSPADETKNYLLLGDGSVMSLREFRSKGNLFHNVDLLVLAACDTGVGGGNGLEIDGFGELAQQSGAKSIVASLWSVRDNSTKDLMVAFYRNLKEGKFTSKIEALRQAQMEVAGLEDLLQKDKNTSREVSRKVSPYSHPYYWGPFIMIGNWR